MSGNQASGRRRMDTGRRKKQKIICPPPSGVDIMNSNAGRLPRYDLSVFISGKYNQESKTANLGVRCV